MDTLKAVAVVIVIGVLFPAAVCLGLNAFYQPPQYNQVVTARYVYKAKNKTEEAANKQYHQQVAHYKALQKHYNTVYLFICLGIGLIALIIGLLLHMPLIPPGLLFGGIVTIIIGILDAWSTTGAAAQFVAILLVLLVVLALVWRLNHRKTS